MSPNVPLFLAVIYRHVSVLVWGSLAGMQCIQAIVHHGKLVTFFTRNSQAILPTTAVKILPHWACSILLQDTQCQMCLK